jgi:hypothetical protein
LAALRPQLLFARPEPGQESIPASIYRFSPPDHDPAFFSREYGLIKPLQQFLFLFFEPLYALKGLLVYPEHSVGHEESLGTLISEKLTADTQGQQVYVSPAQLEDVPDTPLELERSNTGVA